MLSINQLSIIKVSPHQKWNSLEGRGTNAAHAVTKQTAGFVTTQLMVRDEQDDMKELDTDEIWTCQNRADVYE